MHRSLGALAPVLLALAVPSAAGAATLTTQDGAVVFTGGSGGTSVGLSVAGDGRVEISSTLEDPITSGTGACEVFEDDPYTAYCSAGALRVLMGAGDDGVRVHAPLDVPLTVDGGEGDDGLSGSYEGGSETLSGGPGDDSITGSGGNDVVDGGPGRDKVNGGPGADTVLGGEDADELVGDDDASIGADVIDGGGGHDTLSDYSSVGREGLGAVSLTLGVGGGFPGEGDEVRGVEQLQTHTGGTYVGTDASEKLFVGGEATTVEGRGGDDEIFTSYAADTIDAGAGADVVRGYSGDDRITGGPGADTLYGDTSGQECNVLTCSIYSGNDVIDARDGERDSVDCGLGTDTLLADGSDVHVNCEDVKAGGSGSVTVAKAKLKRALAKGLTVKVAGVAPGSLKVTARAGKKLVASGTAAVGGDGTGTAKLRFTKKAKKSLKRKKSVTLTVAAGSLTTTVKVSR